MLDTLTGGVYDVHLGGALGSLISLPLLEHGTFPAIDTASSPTGAAEYPLPVDWGSGTDIGKSEIIGF